MAPVERFGTYDGVRYVVTTDGDGWYCREDVERVLGTDLGGEDVSERYYHADDGEGAREYIASGALAHAVDEIIGFNTETMRQLWVGAWYDDLTFYVGTGEPLSTMFGGDSTGDTLIGLVERSGKAARTDAERETAGLRDDVRGIASSMALALDTLEDSVTFVDGMRFGMTVASQNGCGMGTLSNLFSDLRGVEDAMQRIHSQLEDLAGGDGDE